MSEKVDETHRELVAAIKAHGKALLHHHGHVPDHYFVVNTAAGGVKVQFYSQRFVEEDA